METEIVLEDLSMTEEYFERTKYYQKQYGPNTLVLMQSGAFYEVYGYKLQNQEEFQGSLISVFSQLCDMTISDKKAQYHSHPLFMAGFRDYQLEKYVKKLVEHQLTVVVFSQKNEMDTGKVKKKQRFLDGIYSPGTYMSFDTITEQQWSNHIMSIWVDNSGKTKQIIIGIAIYNTFTGETYLLEQHIANHKIQCTTFDELEKCLSIYRPKEVICVSDTIDLGKLQGLRDVHIHSFSYDKTEVKNATKQVYQKHIITNYFGVDAITQCAEFQYYQSATQSFCLLMHFLEEHNPNLCKNVKLPVWENQSSLVLLANHTLQQLNMIDESRTKPSHLSSVHSWTNKCQTILGKRAFFYALTHPTFDEKRLELEYETIDNWLLNPTYSIKIEEVRKQLSNVYDISALMRQLLLRRLYPSGLYKLYSSLLIVDKLWSYLQTIPWMIPYLKHDVDITDLSEHIKTFFLFMESRFCLKVCGSLSQMKSSEEPLFQKGVSMKLDKLYTEHSMHQQQIHEIHQFLERQMSNQSQVGEFVKYCQTEKYGISLQMTKLRCDLLKKKMKSREDECIILAHNVRFYWKEVSFIPSGKNNVEIQFPYSEHLCKALGRYHTELESLTQEVYSDILKTIETQFYPLFEKGSQFIARIDVLLNKCFIAQKYHYCRPTLATSDTQKSFVKAKGVRHILIEQINQNELYVPNDVCLGVAEGDVSLDGILLFGTNAVGKTSLMRALGICLLLAQAGMYVPCSSFYYRPYRSIFSRILNNDNLFQGQSTFAVEMSELRVILQYADSNSFILGDELCSGTETTSAQCIFMSALERLHEREASFLFATHFHEMVDFPELKALERIRCYHLEVTYDVKKDCLVYDRVLKEGSGPSTYGLEVCKSLYLDQSFLDRAYEIRQRHFPEFTGALSLTTSRYNAKKIKGKCEKCGKVGLEIHHMIEQKEADETGYISNQFHKNHVSNLMTLCEECHDSIHQTKTIIRKKTTKGYASVI